MPATTPLAGTAKRTCLRRLQSLFVASFDFLQIHAAAFEGLSVLGFCTLVRHVGGMSRLGHILLHQVSIIVIFIGLIIT